MSTTPAPLKYKVALSHGPCIDGQSAILGYYNSLPADVKRQLMSYGGIFNPKVEADNEYFKQKAKLPTQQDALVALRNGAPLVVAYIQHTDEIIPELVWKQDVLMLDTATTAAQLTAILPVVNSITIIDSHFSSRRITNQFRGTMYGHKLNVLVEDSGNHSAASLTWELFNPGMPLPPLINYVRLVDNKKFEDPSYGHASNVVQALSLDYIFHYLPTLASTIANWTPEIDRSLNERGAIIQKVEEGVVAGLARQGDIGYISTRNVANEIQVYRIAYTNAPVFHSKVASFLRKSIRSRAGGYQPIDFVATWKYKADKDLVIVSLRYPREGLNLDEVARQISGVQVKAGGGHVGATSFSFNGIQRLPQIIARHDPLVPSDLASSSAVTPVFKSIGTSAPQSIDSFLASVTPRSPLSVPSIPVVKEVHVSPPPAPITVPRVEHVPQVYGCPQVPVLGSQPSVPFGQPSGVPFGSQPSVPSIQQPTVPTFNPAAKPYVPSFMAQQPVVQPQLPTQLPIQQATQPSVVMNPAAKPFVPFNAAAKPFVPSQR